MTDRGSGGLGDYGVVVCVLRNASYLARLVTPRCSCSVHCPFTPCSPADTLSSAPIGLSYQWLRFTRVRLGGLNGRVGARIRGRGQRYIFGSPNFTNQKFWQCVSILLQAISPYNCLSFFLLPGLGPSVDMRYPSILYVDTHSCYGNTWHYLGYMYHSSR